MERKKWEPRKPILFLSVLLRPSLWFAIICCVFYEFFIVWECSSYGILIHLLFIIHVICSDWHVSFSTSFTVYITCNFLVVDCMYFVLKIAIWRRCEKAPWKDKWNGWCLCRSMHRTSQRNGCSLHWYLVKDASSWRLAETLLKVMLYQIYLPLLNGDSWELGKEPQVLPRKWSNQLSCWSPHLTEAAACTLYIWT